MGFLWSLGGCNINALIFNKLEEEGAGVCLLGCTAASESENVTCDILLCNKRPFVEAGIAYLFCNNMG